MDDEITRGRATCRTIAARHLRDAQRSLRDAASALDDADDAGTRALVVALRADLTAILDGFD